MILLIECEGSAPSQMELPPGEYSLGADDSNAIVISHPTVSGHHCDLFIQGDGQIILLDAGSTNGTWLEGEPVGKAVLSPGQSFLAGAARITVNKARPRPIPVPRRMPAATPHPVAAAAPPSPASATPALPALSGSFFAELPDAFAYPFRGDAYLYIIIAVALENIPMILPQILGVLSWGISIVIGCYLFLIWQQIVRTTIDGRDQFPALPHVSLDWEENFSIYLRYIGLTWICFSPVFFCNIAKMWSMSPPVWLVCCCFGFGCFYFPMALLGFMVTESFMALNPLFFMRSVSKKITDYSFLVCFFALLIGGAYLLSLITKPSTGAGASFGSRGIIVTVSAISEVIGLYLAFVWLRLLGLFYRHHKDRLNWY